MLTFSLIIPVYNEERHIRRCLEAVSRQTIMPNEVIVVDNNCTDNTVAIAKEFPFVTVITESRQGHGFARSAGFNTAHGDVLGRIDADSRIAKNWVAVALAAFTQDAELAGVTGYANTVVLPIFRWPKSTLLSRTYFWFVHARFRTVTMWGANMALRRDWWLKVRESVSLNDNMVHEDQDVSLILAAYGAKIQVLPNLRITTNGQGYRYLPKLLKYYRLFVSTKKLHQASGNLVSKNVRRLGFIQILPGLIGASIVGTLTFIVSLVLFPFDYVIHRLWPKSWWLD